LEAATSPTEGDVAFGPDTGVLEGLLAGLDVPPIMSPTQWAAANWVFSADLAAEAGSYNPYRAAYQPGMLDAITEPGVSRITMKTSAQVGKTTTLMIIIGYCADRMPGPMILVQPTREVAEGFSKETLAGAIRDVPKMHKLFPDPKSRDGDNTIFHKKFPGGFLALAGANSPVQLRRRAIRFAFADEVDAWENQATKEGDPMSLLEKRLTTFWDNKLLASSTPLEKHKSRISRLYDESDQRKFRVPCHECGETQVVEWKLKKGEGEDGFKPTNIHWKPGQPATAEYECEHCHCLWSDAQLKRAVRDGFWKAEKPFNGHAGFWINELYSPWSSLEKVVARYERAVGHPDRMQEFCNTTLGLEWEGEVVGAIEVETLLTRLEEFPPFVVPERAALLTAGVDLQSDRIEVQVNAWGLHEECWILSHIMLMGDPSGHQVWKQLEEHLSRRYKHEAGHRELGIEAAAIDSGGWHTQKAYDFCAYALLSKRPWFPIKGDDGFGRPMWKRSPISLKSGVKLIIAGVDDAKLRLYKALKVAKPGPGYVHLPSAFNVDRIAGDDQALVRRSLKALTIEKLITEADPQGFPSQKWHIPEGARNEELDCAAYNRVAFAYLMIDDALMEKRLQKVSKPKPPPMDPAEIARMFAR